MPGGKPLAEPCDVIYIYDGSFEGFLCCVHESVYSRELPQSIVPEGELEPTLFGQRRIETDSEKARKVYASIPAKISKEALGLVRNIFLSCLKDKELATLRFLLKGYRIGAGIMQMLGEADVAVLLKAERHVMHESHLLKGFIRFSDYDGFLAAAITPKNFVLPFIASHFIERFSGEKFMIYDKAHQAALVYRDRKYEIIRPEHIEFPQASETEEKYRELWKRFYDTIAIDARYNPKCRMSHMPKRYWENMTEVKELLKQ
ncbi:MAG: TIGR03915 family putative DNA repair protein [Oscillospiraceae bacterium]|nr:TIGR03915 family putative DNA repair protein [Oscillospiraceae bacterium]